MASIGQQLQQSRLALELSVDDVTFRTRIPAGLVRDMENDDLSHFANLTYARGFLKLYSHFLGLDISDYLSQFSTHEFSHASGHEYVQTANATMNLPAAVITGHGKSRRPGLFILLLIAFGAGGVVWWNNRDAGETPDSGGVQQAEPAGATPAANSAGDSVPPPAVAETPPPAVGEPTVPPAPSPTIPSATDPVPSVPADTPPVPPAKPPKAVVVDENEPAPPPPPPP